MNDLKWARKGGQFILPLDVLRHHIAILGASGSGKTETIHRLAYGARKVYELQTIYLDAKGESKREEENTEDNAARFYAAMKSAGAHNIAVFPSIYLNGWQGTPTDLKNRLLAIIDTNESAYYGDVAANAVDLALNAPTTPRSSSHFLANLRYERLKSIYQLNDPAQYQRVLRLDKDLLRQVEMRYQVFFQAMDGMLDGTLDYSMADAVYLKVKGFTLRDQAPRLGRFLVLDFMHYLAERKKPGTLTLLIIDEFNALRMGEEASLLFEQCRSFGGCLAISAQGFAGLGPREYSLRILDACSTYVLHACSDPFEVSRRAGKRFYFESSWTENDEGSTSTRIVPRYDWKVPEDAVIRQETGQAFWIYRGKTAHVQSVRVQLPKQDISDAWSEIRSQEAWQQQLLRQQAEQKSQELPEPEVKQEDKKPRRKRTTTTPATRKRSGQKVPSYLVADSAIQDEWRDPQAISPEPMPEPPKTAPATPRPAAEDDEPDEF